MGGVSNELPNQFPGKFRRYRYLLDASRSGVDASAGKKTEALQSSALGARMRVCFLPIGSTFVTVKHQPPDHP